MPTSTVQGGTDYRRLGPQAPLIAASAIAHRLDPRVALAVAYGEGGFNHAKPGDNNTSFGPFQLHMGGALPSVYDGNPKAADKWANSPAGIDYAVGRIAAVTRGMQGQAAIDAAVRDFERPANPNPEIAKDTKFYNTLASGSYTGFGTPTSPSMGATGGTFPNATSGQPGVAGKTVPNVFDSCQGEGHFLGFIPYPSPGGMVCYVTGFVKVSFFAIGGLVVMGVGFYLMLPRYRAKVNAVTLGMSGAVAGKAGLSGTAAVAQTHAAHHERGAALAAERAEADRAIRRARVSRERARAREARSKARTAKYNEPGPLRLSAATEASIKRSQSRPAKSRPDRVRG